MLYLSEEDVRAFLPMRDAITVMRQAFEALAQGTAINQPRRRLILDTGSTLHSMAGAYRNYFGTKFYSSNPKHGVHFYFVLYDAHTAEPLAWMQASGLSQIRTGAASGYATELLANPEADTLGVIGSGYQALTQVEAIRAVRPIKTIRVWSRSEEKRRKFADETGAEAVATAEEAVRRAQIVVTATNSSEPVIEDGWIEPGTLINAIGANSAQRHELPQELIQRATLIAVDSIEQAKIEAAELIHANIWSRVRELGGIPLHYDPNGITIFKSLGIAVEDVAAAAFVYERAQVTPERFADRNRAKR
jgi:alanine dehydrogenase